MSITYALDLDQPAIQQAVLRSLVVVAECLRRAADAIEQGSPGRERACEELLTAQLLSHYLRRRVAERTAAEG
jgi:hypothetical protein